MPHSSISETTKRKSVNASKRSILVCDTNKSNQLLPLGNQKKFKSTQNLRKEDQENLQKITQKKISEELGTKLDINQDKLLQFDSLSEECSDMSGSGNVTHPNQVNKRPSEEKKENWNIKIISQETQNSEEIQVKENQNIQEDKKDNLPNQKEEKTAQNQNVNNFTAIINKTTIINNQNQYHSINNQNNCFTAITNNFTNYEANRPSQAFKINTNKDFNPFKTVPSPLFQQEIQQPSTPTLPKPKYSQFRKYSKQKKNETIYAIERQYFEQNKQKTIENQLDVTIQEMQKQNDDIQLTKHKILQLQSKIQTINEKLNNYKKKQY